MTASFFLSLPRVAFAMCQPNYWNSILYVKNITNKIMNYCDILSTWDLTMKANVTAIVSWWLPMELISCLNMTLFLLDCTGNLSFFLNLENKFMGEWQYNSVCQRNQNFIKWKSSWLFQQIYCKKKTDKIQYNKSCLDINKETTTIFLIILFFSLSFQCLPFLYFPVVNSCHVWTQVKENRARNCNH